MSDRSQTDCESVGSEGTSAIGQLLTSDDTARLQTVDDALPRAVARPIEGHSDPSEGNLFACKAFRDTDLTAGAQPATIVAELAPGPWHA